MSSQNATAICLVCLMQHLRGLVVTYKLTASKQLPTVLIVVACVIRFPPVEQDSAFKFDCLRMSSASVAVSILQPCDHPVELDLPRRTTNRHAATLLVRVATWQRRVYSSSVSHFDGSRVTGSEDSNRQQAQSSSPFLHFSFFTASLD